MVKLDVSVLRYLTKEDFRVLIAVEMGMKNHELVPAPLVASIASLKHGGVGKTLQDLCRHKLVAYERGKRYDGYRLTYLGYDYLALNALTHREILSQVGNQIGVGKESDVYVAANDKDERFALKIHRLGRTCFRNVTDKRDYQRHGKKVHSWIYMSRLAALREFAFMKALHDKGFPVPRPVDVSRHCVVMEMIQGTLLNNLTPDSMPESEKLYEKLMNLLLSLANDYGVVHGDFNEFNIMIVDDTNEPILIDFPQMVALNHKFAEGYFARDVNCIVDFFKKRFNYCADSVPTWEDDVTKEEAVSSFITEIVKKNVDLDDGESEEEEEVGDKFDDAKEVLVEDLVPNLEKPHEAQTSEAVSEVDSVVPDDDVQSVHTIFSTTSRSTFAPQEVKGKLKREKIVKAKRAEIRSAAKNVKGDSSAVFRRRHDEKLTIKEDLDIHQKDGF